MVTKVKKSLKIMVGIYAILFLAALGLLLPHFLKIQKDFDRLQSEEYDTVFFSMYPTGNYNEEDYAHFRAMDVVRTDYQISHGKIMRLYMDMVNETGNMVTTVYLGIDPEHTSKEDIVLLIQQNPQISFHVVLAYPQMDYWLSKSASKCEEILQTYQTFAEWMLPLENADTYLFSGEEWLICNGENYEDTFLVNEAVALFLMCNTDTLHPYYLQTENVQDKFDNMRQLIRHYREEPVAYADASGRDIVFLGDSIIGNYTDSLSVPYVVKGLTGANVFNCGYGGTSAAMGEKTPIPLPGVVDALITGEADLFPADEQIYAGITEFTNRREGNALTFVINYGLNDYFEGFPVETADARDVCSYSGAMRLAVEKLKAAYPEAQILLMTPNFTALYEAGQAKNSEQGGCLADYAETVISLAEELQVEVLDNFHELPITAENWQTYSTDGCHLNERGRFLLGSRIAERLQEKIP